MFDVCIIVVRTQEIGTAEAWRSGITSSGSFVSDICSVFHSLHYVKGMPLSIGIMVNSTSVILVRNLNSILIQLILVLVHAYVTNHDDGWSRHRFYVVLKTFIRVSLAGRRKITCAKSRRFSTPIRMKW